MTGPSIFFSNFVIRLANCRKDGTQLKTEKTIQTNFVANTAATTPLHVDAASAGNGGLRKTGTGDRRSGYAGVVAERSGI